MSDNDKCRVVIKHDYDIDFIPGCDASKAFCVDGIDRVFGSIPRDWKYCPYCGREIEIVEDQENG